MPSTTAKRHRMRCTTDRCRHRFTLRKHPDLYRRNKYKCPVCGGKASSVEAARQREQKATPRCRCDGYPFPHAKGSMRFCMYHPDIYEAPSAEEIDAYEGVLATPRSGVS